MKPTLISTLTDEVIEENLYLFRITISEINNDGRYDFTRMNRALQFAKRYKYWTLRIYNRRTKKWTSTLPIMGRLTSTLFAKGLVFISEDERTWIRETVLKQTNLPLSSEAKKDIVFTL